MEKQDLKLLHEKLLEIVSDIDIFCRNNNIDYVLSSGNVIGAIRHKGFIPWDDDLDIEMTRENYDKFLLLFKNNEKYYLQKDTIDYPMQFSKLRANNTTFIEDIPYRKKFRKMHQGIYIDIFPVDKVSKNKIKAKMQCVFANIITAQSLFLRGYPKSHRTILKNIIIILSLLFLPFRNFLNNYVKAFNNSSDFDFYCSFYGSTKKHFLLKSTYEGPFQLFPYEHLSLPLMNNYDLYLRAYYGDYMKLPSEEKRIYSIHAKYFSVENNYKDFIEER